MIFPLFERQYFALPPAERMLLLAREASLLLGCVARASRQQSSSLQLTNLRHVSLRPASHAVARRPASPTHLGVYASQVGFGGEDWVAGGEVGGDADADDRCCKGEN